jgi:hypothetical protein
MPPKPNHMVRLVKSLPQPAFALADVLMLIL